MMGFGWYFWWGVLFCQYASGVLVGSVTTLPRHEFLRKPTRKNIRLILSCTTVNSRPDPAVILPCNAPYFAAKEHGTIPIR